MLLDLKLFIVNGWKEEKLFILTGGLGGLLALLCLTLIGLNGSFIPPEGNLYKAVSFNSAVGLFTVTTAYILFISNFSKKKKAIFRNFYFVLVLLSYGIETIQHARGIDPRFTNEGTIVDSLVGAGFGVISLGLFGGYLWLIYAIWKKGILLKTKVATLALYYGFSSIIISFLFGLVMVGLQDEFVIAQGSFLWVHGFGFHGIQVLAFIAWLIHYLETTVRRQGHFIHLSGIAWHITLLLLFLQAMNGKRLLEPSIWLYLSISTLSICLVPVFIMLKHLIKRKNQFPLRHS